MEVAPILFPSPGDFSSLFKILAQALAFWKSVSSNSLFMAVQTFLFFLSALFLAGIISLVWKTYNLNLRLNATKKNKEIRFAEEASLMKSKRFEVVKKHMESANPAEWRLAIIEADTLLEEMVKRMGYQGATLGDMLKNIEQSDFITLNDAWEAHKIRNQIAHQGSSFLLTEREAKRVVRLYENVFREFDII